MPLDLLASSPRFQSPASFDPPPASTGSRIRCDLSPTVRIEGTIVACDGPLRFVSVERRLERRGDAGTWTPVSVPRNGARWDLAVDVRETPVTPLA